MCDRLSWLWQILSLLPPFKGKDVIELGAGIGRFTGELAKSAGHVIAMDFMENLIKKVMSIETWQKPWEIAFYQWNRFLDACFMIFLFYNNDSRVSSRMRIRTDITRTSTSSTQMLLLQISMLLMPLQTLYSPTGC